MSNILQQFIELKVVIKYKIQKQGQVKMCFNGVVSLLRHIFVFSEKFSVIKSKTLYFDCFDL